MIIDKTNIHTIMIDFVKENKIKNGKLGKASRGGKPRDNREGHREVTVAAKVNKKRASGKEGPVPVTVGTQESAAGQKQKTE